MQRRFFAGKTGRVVPARNDIEGRVNTSDQTEGLLGIFGNRSWCLPVASSALTARSWEPGPVGSSWKEKESVSLRSACCLDLLFKLAKHTCRKRRCSRAWVDISVLSRLPALCDPGQAGKGRGQARMSVCDTISGVDAMTEVCCCSAPREMTWKRRHRNAMTALKDLARQRQQFQGRTLGDHI